MSRSSRGHQFVLCVAIFLALALAGIAQTPAPPAPTQDYLVYVVCESADKVVLIRFGPNGAHIESQFHIGLMPMDVNGPHGVVVSPDKQFFYVAVGHGRPDGSAWKFKTGTDSVIKYTSIGLFPLGG